MTTVSLELRPEELAALRHHAEAEGVDIETVVHRLIAQIVPSPTPETRELTEKQKGGIAPMQAWRREDETDDPEALAERNRELEELKANLNRWRAEEGRPRSSPGTRRDAR